jgi:hypothetical protein
MLDLRKDPQSLQALRVCSPLRRPAPLKPSVYAGDGKLFIHKEGPWT